jgi:hypothetical protein
MAIGKCSLAMVMLIAQSIAAAQTSGQLKTKTGLPGIMLAPVPELLQAQLPQLSRGQGLVVTQVEADAPAGLGGLNKHDVLLTVDGQTLVGLEQLHRVLQAANSDKKVPLVVLRGGKKVTLHIAAGEIVAIKNAPKGTIKQGDPPAVAIECTVLDGGKLAIKLQYYSESNSKLETVSCNGSLPEIEQKVREQRLPSRVQEMVDVAFKRLRPPGSGNN